MKNPNKNKIILDLCAGTGAWSKPYQNAGYDVRLVTLPDFDIVTYMPPENVYGILAAPPCTMFSLARTVAKIPRNFDEGMVLVKRCLEIIWRCKPKFWALENPVGYLRRFLGKPALTFQPYEFGDHSKKRTDIWGYFNMPKHNPIAKPDYSYKGKDAWNYQFSNKNDVRRSITPPGFAKAFFRANT